MKKLQGIISGRLIGKHLYDARKIYPSLTWKIGLKPEALAIVLISDFELPIGWKNVAPKLGHSDRLIEIMFMIPQLYPSRFPVGVYFNQSLRMSDGTKPGKGFGDVLKYGKQWMYLCMEIKGWDPERDNISRYIKILTWLLTDYDPSKVKIDYIPY